MIGQFRVRPVLDAATGYDGNVFNVQDGRSDRYLVASPRLDVEDDWGGGNLSLSGGATVLRYARLTSENSLALNGRASGRVDLSGTDRLDTNLSVARIPEPRGTGGVGIGLARPLIRNEFHSGIGGTAEVGGLVFSGALRADTQRYGDVPLRSGRIADQRYRNLDTVRAVVELGRRLGGNLVAFTQADVARDRSVSTPAALNRDAIGQTYSMGVRGDLAPLVTAQIVLGYRRVDYANPVYPDFAGPGYAATIDWYPRPLLSMRLTADRLFANSGIAGAAGIDTRREQLTVFWDPTRITRVRLSTTRFDERYRGAALSSGGVEAQVSIRYAFSRHAALTGSIGYRDRSSSNTALVSPYRAGTALVGLSLVP